MTQYVLGFAFSVDKKHVVLIKKKRPVWQKDRYNGIGGKIERNEHPFQAMRREFKEETGVQIDEWDYYAQIIGQDYTVIVYKTFTDDIFKCCSDLSKPFEEREFVGCHLVTFAQKLPTIANLELLIPLALHGDSSLDQTIFYYGDENNC